MRIGVKLTDFTSWDLVNLYERRVIRRQGAVIRKVALGNVRFAREDLAYMLAADIVEIVRMAYWRDILLGLEAHATNNLLDIAKIQTRLR